VARELKRLLNSWPLWLLASLTVGLAPFVPEPHLLGKLRWIAGGAKGMKLIDWLDFVLHGMPWLLLLRALSIL
jgi:hypothetical protein